MADQQHASAGTCVVGANAVDHALARYAVEVGAWFIEGEQFRVEEQRTCDCNPLRFTNRQLAPTPVENPKRQAEQFQPAANLRFVYSVVARVQPQAFRHNFAYLPFGVYRAGGVLFNQLDAST